MAVADVDLARLSDATPSGILESRARCLLRVSGLPVASASLSVERGRVSRDELMAVLRQPVRRGGVRELVARGLARRCLERLSAGAPPGLESALASSDANSLGALPSLTIAVCTRDRTAPLERALSSLGAAPGDGVEVLVVDNAPTTTETERLVRGRFRGVGYVAEPEPGLDRARNRALRSAASDIVAFADDDVVADANWATAVRRAFDSAPEAVAVTGLVEPAALDTPAAQWFEAYGGFGRGYVRRWAHAPAPMPHSIAWSLGGTWRLGTGANLAVRRVDALALGGFDPALDTGTATGGAGDLEWLFRVLKSGAAVLYEPAALVRHTHRHTLEALLQQMESWGTGMRAYLARTARAYPEERWSTAALRYWLYATWWLRRVALSYVHADFPRSMLWRELHGSLAGARLYREAARQTEPPAAPRAVPLPIAGRNVRDIDLDLESPLDHVPADGAALVRARLRYRGRELGSVSLPPVNGVVGAGRVRDSVAEHCRPALFGVSDEELIARLVARAAPP